MSYLSERYRYLGRSIDRYISCHSSEEEVPVDRHATFIYLILSHKVCITCTAGHERRHRYVI